MIVVTTPTGSIGSQVLARLLEAGAAVRAVARDPAKLSPAVRERVEVVEGSHGEAAVVEKAFAGADAVFWLPPPDPTASRLEDVYQDFAEPACAALKRAGVGHVVGVSALGRGTPVEGKAGLVTASLAMDDAIAATGVAYRALANPSFMDNVLRQAEPIARQGVFFSTLSPDRKLPTCATRDIAAVAAGLLLDRDWSSVGEQAVLGPEDLSQNDMARIMSDVLGKPVRCGQVPMEQFERQLAGRGASPAFVKGYADMMSAKDDGLDEGVRRTPGNTTPTTFRHWCEEVLKPAVAKIS